ncbi:MAG: FCD domain-containing protein [Hyphomicrobium sp.]|jgi:DNA-binding FadR family transcriptional regulator
MDASDDSAAPWDRDPSSHPLVTPRVKRVGTELFYRISSGEYSFGTRIPAERELAEEFKESRTTIRQALEFLEHFGVVARRAGSGTFVAYRQAEQRRAKDTSLARPDVSALAETVSPFEMNIARTIIEPEIVRLAAIYMSIRDLTALGALMRQLDGIVTDAQMFAELERRFLMTICEGTHNSLLIAMYRIVNEIRRQPEWSANKTRTLTPARIREALQGLRSLYSALERRNVDTAVECMRLYMSSTQEDLMYASP